MDKKPNTTVETEPMQDAPTAATAEGRSMKSPTKKMSLTKTAKDQSSDVSSQSSESASQIKQTPHHIQGDDHCRDSILNTQVAEASELLADIAGDKVDDVFVESLQEKNVSSDLETEKKRGRLRKKALLKAVLDQMEFYFSDCNLRKDRFLRQLYDASEDGYVDLTVFGNFNKLQSLLKEGVSLNFLRKALAKSTFLEVNEAGTKVRRRSPVVEMNKEEIDRRTIYVEYLPKHANHVWIEKIFSQCGKVCYVSLPTFKTSKEIKGFAFVEFQSPEQAARACAMLNNPPPARIDEKPGKFPKGNKTLSRLQKIVSVKPEDEENEENTNAEPKEEQDSLTAATKKKKKKKSKKRRASESGGEEPSEKKDSKQQGVVQEQQGAQEGKKKKKKKKKKQSDLSVNSEEESSVKGGKAVPENITETKEKGKGDKSSTKQGNKTEDNVNDIAGNKKEDMEVEIEKDTEESKAKKKKKRNKKKKAENEGSADKLTKTRSEKVVDKTSTDSISASSEKQTEKMKSISPSPTPTKAPLSSRMERKRQRQEDIRRKREHMLQSRKGMEDKVEIDPPTTGKEGKARVEIDPPPMSDKEGKARVEIDPPPTTGKEGKARIEIDPPTTTDKEGKARVEIDPSPTVVDRPVSLKRKNESDISMISKMEGSPKKRKMTDGSDSASGKLTEKKGFEKIDREVEEGITTINKPKSLKRKHVDVSEGSEIEEPPVVRRKSDGSELMSCLVKSKKQAVQKKVEFDPVPITTEFIKRKEVRRRKKVKRDSLHLRVITKKEWLSLKSEFIEKQKSHMSALKKALRELRRQEEENRIQEEQKGQKHVDLTDVFGTKRLKPTMDMKMAHLEKLKFRPNVIVQWKCTHEMPRQKIRAMFQDVTTDSIAYIEAEEEAKSGYIRFKDEESAEKFAKLSRLSQTFSARVLPEPQQAQYWEKANRDRIAKLSRKRCERGSERIARKVFERNKATFHQKPSHIVFDDDEKAEKEEENKSKKTQTKNDETVDDEMKENEEADKALTASATS